MVQYGRFHCIHTYR